MQNVGIAFQYNDNCIQALNCTLESAAYVIICNQSKLDRYKDLTPAYAPLVKILLSNIN